jgi:hypothetical protein
MVRKKLEYSLRRHTSGSGVALNGLISFIGGDSIVTFMARFGMGGADLGPADAVSADAVSADAVSADRVSAGMDWS